MIDQKYVPTLGELEELDVMFKHHPPHGDQGGRYDANRRGCLNLANLLLGNCPDGEELGTAIEKLREAMFWANAAIACNEAPERAEEGKTCGEAMPGPMVGHTMPLFFKGDVVRLKSGGPRMTVTKHTEELGVVCAWFTEDDRVLRDGFKAEVLEKVTKEGKVNP